MLKVGDKEQALAFLETATNQWPDYWLSYFLVANHYLSTDDDEAVRWFEKGYNTGKTQTAYVHNYILALRKSGASSKADTILTEALVQFPNDEKLIALKRS